MSLKVQTIIQSLEEIAPKDLAQDWDNVGLQIGNPLSETSKVLLALDINDSIIKEALDIGAKMIVVHHPLIFKPISQVIYTNPKSRMISSLICSGISLYVMHTNLDISPMGINDYLANVLKIKNSQILQPTFHEKLYKLVVFIPEGYQDKVRKAICEAGAGWIGNYSNCTFQTAGQGSFMPLEGSKPFLGEYNKIEFVNEYRLETIVSQKVLKKVINSMLNVHPYEEVAYDLIPLTNQGFEAGLGRIGYLECSINLKEYAIFVKKALNVDNLRVIGDSNRLIHKVAVCGGSGSSLLKHAAFHGADVFVTGDVKYHDALEALEYGICIIDAGHFETEVLYLVRLQELLQKKLDKYGEVEVLVSQKSNIPYWVV